jgi:glycosyltransferase involved in cell wall biosynthesis
MPLASVLIPTYNRAQYLKEAIRSVQDQTFQDLEIIVIDDGSTDNTREVIKEISSPEIKYLYQENRGAGAARNAGIRASSGKWIAFLDADDIWMPSKLELQIQALIDHPRARAAYCDMYFFGAIDSNFPETYFRSLKWTAPRGRVLDKMAVKSFGIPSTLVVYRDAFTKIGLFDENLPYCDDYDMLLRLAANFEFEVVPFPLIKYRLHPQQVSKNEGRVLTDHIAVFSKSLKLPGVQGGIYRTLKKRLADTHFQYAVLLFRRGRWPAGLQQVYFSLRADPWRLFPSGFHLAERLWLYIFRQGVSYKPIRKELG